MTTHELKIWPEYFAPVLEWRKTFELRRNDRKFQQGDILWLREWDPKTNDYVGPTVYRRVLYVLKGFGGMGLEDGFCIMGLGPV